MKKRFSLVVMGCSAGGIEAMKNLLPQLTDINFPPMAIVQHRAAEYPAILVPYFNDICRLPVKEAESKETLQNGHIYFAPAGYHLLISEDGTSFDLSVDEPEHYSRPSIDVLFESAADAKGAETLGIILTGANEDGARGLKRIHRAGGRALVQNPEEALFAEMPRAALEQCPQADKFSLLQIGRFLMELPGAR